MPAGFPAPPPGFGRARRCRPRWPHRGGVVGGGVHRAPALAARSGLGAEHSRLPLISLRAASRRRLAHCRLCGRQGKRGSRGLPSGTARRASSGGGGWWWCVRGTGGGGGGGPFLLSPASQFPSRAADWPLCSAVPLQGPRGARGGPHLSRGLCSPSARGGVGGHGRLFSTHRPTGPQKPRRPQGERERGWPGVPSGEEGEGSRERSPSLGKLDESSGRGRRPPPRRSKPFPGAAVAAEHLFAAALGSCRSPPGARPGLGPRYAGRRHGGERRTPISHGAWAPSATPPSPASPGRAPSPPPTPPLPPSAGLAAGRGDNGGCDRAGRRAGGRRRLSAVLPLLAARAAASSLADRSANVSQGLLQGLRGVMGNS